MLVNFSNTMLRMIDVDDDGTIHSITVFFLFSDEYLSSFADWCLCIVRKRDVLCALKTQRSEELIADYISYTIFHDRRKDIFSTICVASQLRAIRSFACGVRCIQLAAHIYMTV